MLIDVVLPTIDGREDHLRRCIDAYHERTANFVQLHVVRNASACGIAWNQGVERITRFGRGDYLHFTADDLEPVDGWDVAAIKACEAGTYPAARVDNADGTATTYWGSSLHPVADGTPVDCGFVPFMSWAMWDRIGPSLNCHYWTDLWLGWRANMEGYPNIYTADYAFRHHAAQVGRRQDRLPGDHILLVEAQRQYMADHP